MSKMRVPERVARQLEAIRSSGEINMFDRSGVQLIADRREFYELVLWLEDHRADYGTVIFHGIEPVAEDEGRR